MSITSRVTNAVMVSVRRNPKQTHVRSMTYSVIALLSLLSITWLYGYIVMYDNNKSEIPKSKCSINFISDLSDAQLNPVAGERHMITPPQGGKLSLLCFETTQGNMNLLVHERWAPIGVARLLEMVQNRYFETKIPLFRCTDACQFGLAGDPKFTERFSDRLQDDPMWLPPGPNHQENSQGVRRYPQGYFTYAGGGNHTRTNQFVLTLKPNKFMGGGSPWEVPMGELVGKESFETMSKFYTGYGEKGPPQGLLRREGNSIKVQTEWPLLDYITGCKIVDEVTLPN